MRFETRYGLEGYYHCWESYGLFDSHSHAKDAIAEVAHDYPFLTKFRIIRYDENVILEISKEHALNPT